MKQQIEQLIDRLASKELTFGQRIKFVYEDGSRVDNDIYKLVSAYEFTPVGRKSKRFMVKMMTSPSFDVLHGNYPNQAAFWKHARLQGHPILIGDVLKRIDGYEYAVTTDGHFLKLAESKETGLMVYEGTGAYWEPTKSLQSIVDEVEWVHEAKVSVKFTEEGLVPDKVLEDSLEVPKQPKIRNLFEFLISLNLAE